MTHLTVAKSNHQENWLLYPLRGIFLSVFPLLSNISFPQCDVFSYSKGKPSKFNTTKVLSKKHHFSLVKVFQKELKNYNVPEAKMV